MRLPLYQYGDHVILVPNDRIEGRIWDLHYYGQYDTTEYDVRYFHDGRDYKVRCFEDELEFDPTKEKENGERRARRGHLVGKSEQVPPRQP